MESVTHLLAPMCCEMMEHYTQPCADGCKVNECPDQLVIFTQAGPSLPVRDGGSSYVPIKWCPWCGEHIGQEEGE